MIVQELHNIQRCCGFVPEEELRRLADRTGTPLYRLEEVSSFFPHFRRTRPAEVEVKVCRDMACHLRGAAGALAGLESFAQQFDAQQLQVSGVSCMGRCDHAPVVTVSSGHESRNYLCRSVGELQEIVQQTISGSPPPADTDAALLDSLPPWQIDVYQGKPQYSAVRRFIESADKQNERQRIIKALETAGLLGMGGAGGRTYKKWTDVLEAAGSEKYVVCNADESEPGTFKDRDLLLRTPHLVLEGVILAGLVLGANTGYIYIRHEYEEQIAAVQRAIHEAEEQGFCGRDILGSEFSFPVEVFVSPGGYICGEQTALIEVLEDKRAEPRNRPPELQTNGLWDKPTLLNNVETLAWVPTVVLREEGQWYAKQGAGAGEFKGLRFFSISGDVKRPGAYEVPNGITLRKLVFEYAGGLRDDQPLKAFCPSGPSGGFLPAKLPAASLPERFVREKLPPGATHFDILDVELDLKVFRTLGLMLGAGLTIYGENTDLVDQALCCLRFYRNESCGKCVPCRIGSQKLVEIATELHRGHYDRDAWNRKCELVSELADTMELTAICGLGTVASNPLTSLTKFFPADVQRYLCTNPSAATPQTP